MFCPVFIYIQSLFMSFVMLRSIISELYGVDAKIEILYRIGCLNKLLIVIFILETPASYLGYRQANCLIYHSIS